MNLPLRVLHSFAGVGRKIISAVSLTGFSVLLFFKTIFYLKNSFGKRHEIMKQMFNTSVRTVMVTSIVAMFTGMILALQTGIELKQFNMEENIGNLLIATLTREMGPFVTAIILIASVGSAMAAEIGTMKVSEELDALEIMSISPVKFLVMPRVLALSIMLPVMTIYTNVLGCVGGAIVAKTHLFISFDTFYVHVLESLHFKALYVGLFKSFVFGVSISIICCARGLNAGGGAMGVGKATRDSVVASFLMVLISGYYITEMFYGKGM